MAIPRRSLTELDQNAAGAHFLIVEARYYDSIGAMLLAGAKAALERARASYELVSVPGALEIPIAIEIATDQAKRAGAPFAGAIALGCVIRGETYHFEIVAAESARALMQLAVAHKLPLGNGILTVDTEAQAEERADPDRGDKGGDAARAAIALHCLARRAGALS
ncbi:6,7-dimethyl-8-ribityllumazine synthase [Methylocella silvestris]|uniref:6,7-dimethyl-8-ribityllumazine synthase n=1 Tax=Methylocella silvestris TaxID=199596 RepID=A0A2J7TGS6_METSI|nr:6,7-dimethyl-8-ribityllumazine synthase [Methylocella silvestris]PNG25984.1 6,7-dimethyl-8-ribityllumazine synthase [Methylocella silvestris]